MKKLLLCLQAQKWHGGVSMASMASMAQELVDEVKDGGANEVVEVNDVNGFDSEVNILRRHMKKRDPNEAKYAQHRAWMSLQQREFPLPYTPYRIGVYIRYYNQTDHEDYLEYHKQQFRDDIALCPRWTLVDFYVDEGARAPRMENAPEWCRLVTDCLNGDVDLIVTQNISFVSRNAEELIFISQLLASYGVSIYFISEDVFTTASYFRSDMFQQLKLTAMELPDDEDDDELFYTEYRAPMMIGADDDALTMIGAGGAPLMSEADDDAGESDGAKDGDGAGEDDDTVHSDDIGKSDDAKDGDGE